jgi:hypothetical protein
LVAIDLFSLSIFHGLECNDRLLQLFECIESMKSDVKKKMMCGGHATHAPKSPSRMREESFLHNVSACPHFFRKRLRALAHLLCVVTLAAESSYAVSMLRPLCQAMEDFPSVYSYNRG